MIRYSDTQGEHTITEAEAIERQRAAGILSGHVYESDESALEDFVTVNWARRTE